MVVKINPWFYQGSGKRAERTIKRASYKQARKKEPPLCKGRWHAKRDGRVVDKRKTIPHRLRRSSLYTREPMEVTRLRVAVRVML